MNNKILDENNNNNNKISSDEEDEEENERDETYENLLKSRFKQQQLPCWRPKPTLISFFSTYLLFGLGLIGFGIFLYFFEPYEEKLRYDNCIKDEKNYCNVEFKLTEKLKKGHILVSYELKGFNQNHRIFINSKSEKQLKGEKTTEGCGDLSTNEQMDINLNFNNEPINKSADAIPCGLFAKTFFTDRFILYKNNSNDKYYKEDTPIEIRETGIAWKNDIDKFKNIDFDDDDSSCSSECWKNHQWLDMTDEHFIVWMRPAFLNNFRKLWGKIEDQDLDKGEYYFKIKNNYNISDDIEKYVVISKINYFGSENQFMIFTSMIIGGICVFIAFYLFYLSKKKKNKII